MLSLIAYNFILIFSVFFAWLATLKQRKATRVIFVSFSFLCIFIPTFIRFDVGPDYYGYVNIFNDLRFREAAPKYVEYSFFILSRLFEDFEYGYVFILGFYSFFSLLIVYLYSGVNRLPYVLFVFLTASVGYFTFDDQVRQFLAIAIWLFGVRFIVEKRLFFYISVCLFASVFHFSAILMIPFYYLARITLPIKVMLFIFFIMVCFFYFDLSSFIFKSIFEIIPYYSKYAHQEDYIISGTATATGLGVLLNTAIFMYAVCYRRNAGHLYLTNLLFFGIVIMLLSSGNLVITRFSKFFLVLGIFLVSQVLYVQKNIIHKFLIMVLLLIFFERAIINRDNRDLSYQTVFSDNFKSEILRRDLQK